MHLSTWTIESAEEQSERILYYQSELSIWLQLRSHTYNSNLFNVYVTQDKSKIELFDTIILYLLIVRVSLLPHIFLLDKWQSLSKKHSFDIINTITSITSAKNYNFRDRRSKHRCIEYHQWRAEQEQCIAKKQHRHAVEVYSSVTRWIEAIDSLLST